jgi:hypothetical protein
MSKDWASDIEDMHSHYGFHDRVKDMTRDQLRAMLEFRYRFLQEELKEMGDSIDTNDPEGVVDALIDLCVVAIGTLDLYEVNAHKAWDKVHSANMAKRIGIKASRPNPLGLPDLVKPEGWVGPDHSNNHGYLDEALTFELGPVNKVPTDILK